MSTNHFIVQFALNIIYLTRILLTIRGSGDDKLSVGWLYVATGIQRRVKYKPGSEVKTRWGQLTTR